MPYLHFFADQHCAVCGRTSDFSLLYAHALAVREQSGDNTRWRESQTDFRGLFFCGHCRSPVTLDLRLKATTSPHQVPQQSPDLRSRAIPQPGRFLNRLQPAITYHSGSTQPYNTGIKFESHEWGSRLNDLFQIVARYPDAVIQSPAGIPPSLARDFEELRNVAASPRYTVIACRRLLERACKTVLGESAPPRARLADLIDATLGSAETVSSIADWGHAIRALGNDAVHDDSGDPSTEEAREAVEFTSLLVELLFSYPARVASLRKAE